MLVNRLLEILVSIICKQYLKRNVSKHKLQAIYVQKHSISNIYGLDFSLKIKSASSNICAKSSNSRWMKMAKIGLPKGSGKRLKVREKSVKSQGILKYILSGNPVTLETEKNVKLLGAMIWQPCESTTQQCLFFTFLWTC